ncbi:hypothetical protein SNEBB_003803 [Seison nebaliae]|nr:hypothetical protein SNEBB_003803 [Seison nebaliae]
MKNTPFIRLENESVDESFGYVSGESDCEENVILDDSWISQMDKDIMNLKKNNSSFDFFQTIQFIYQKSFGDKKEMCRNSFLILLPLLTIYSIIYNFIFFLLLLLIFSICLLNILYKLEDSFLFYPNLLYSAYLRRHQLLDIHDLFSLNTPIRKTSTYSALHQQSQSNLFTKSIHIKSFDDNKIHSLYFPPNSLTNKKLKEIFIIHFHGNAGSVFDRQYEIPKFQNIFNCHILLVEYRGFGLSSSFPNEKYLEKDSLYVLDFVKNNFPKLPIILFGRSLGGAVAIDLMYRRQNDLAGVIIDNTFLSIPKMGREIAGANWVNKLPNFLVASKFNSEGKLKMISKNIPILFLSGEMDELVPPSMMEQLYDIVRCSNQNRSCLVRIVNGTHNGGWDKSNKTHQISKILS